MERIGNDPGLPHILQETLERSLIEDASNLKASPDYAHKDMLINLQLEEAFVKERTGEISSQAKCHIFSILLGS